MDDNALNVQNTFFNQVRKDKTRVIVILNNGQRISGVVKSFDKFTFLVDTRDGEQMIFKHAVSTVSIQRARENRERGQDKRREKEKQGFGNYMNFQGVETKKE